MEITKQTGKISIRKIELTNIQQKDINKLAGIGMKKWK